MQTARFDDNAWSEEDPTDAGSVARCCHGNTDAVVVPFNGVEG